MIVYKCSFIWFIFVKNQIYKRLFGVTFEKKSHIIGCYSFPVFRHFIIIFTSALSKGKTTRHSDKYINRQNILNDLISTRLCIIQWGSLFFKGFTAIWCTARLMTIVPWIQNLAKLLCATWALTFYFHCAIFQLNAQIAHGDGLSRSLSMTTKVVSLNPAHGEV